MRFASACTFSACLLLAACATDPDQHLRKLLVGHWEHTVGILGERRISQLIFEADGTFLQTGYAEAWRSRIGYVAEKGSWSISGGTLQMHYHAAQRGAQVLDAQTDVRRIIRLSESEFVSADAKFGIELDYRRSRSP